MNVNDMGIDELRLAVQELRRYIEIPPAEFQRMRTEIERLEGVIRLAGRKLAACKEYADTGKDGYCMVNILLREAAKAAEKK